MTNAPADGLMRLSVRSIYAYRSYTLFQHEADRFHNPDALTPCFMLVNQTFALHAAETVSTVD